jgi:Protein of unknown function (DUF2971)
MTSNDPVHPLFGNVPPPEAKLWRYLSFAKFVSLLQSERLHFTRVDHFDDHFEGAWPKSDLEFWTAERMIKHFNVPHFTEQMRFNVAASCWFESPDESAAMWRLYAPGNESVAVATSFAKLKNFVEAPKEPNVLSGAARVTYIDHFNDGLIKNLTKGERLPNTLMPLMLKNISYKYENEVRALIIAEAPPGIPGGGLNLRLKVVDFVEEIRINPFCQTWFRDAVTEVARHYGLERRLHPSSLSPDVFYIDRRNRSGVR